MMENGDGVLSLRRDSESEVLQGPFREERARNDVGFWFLRCNQPSLEVMRNSSRNVVCGKHMKITKKASLLSSCGTAVGSTRTGPVQKGMPGHGCKMATRR